jgi:hypothetical protein
MEATERNLFTHSPSCVACNMKSYSQCTVRSLTKLNISANGFQTRYVPLEFHENRPHFRVTVGDPQEYIHECYGSISFLIKL